MLISFNVLLYFVVFLFVVIISFGEELFQIVKDEVFGGNYIVY